MRLKAAFVFCLCGLFVGLTGFAQEGHPLTVCGMYD